MPRVPAQPSFGERRGHRLAPLQTNFTSPPTEQQQQPPPPQLKTEASRLQRPRPSDPIANGSEGPVPLTSPVKRQSSKTSLRSLFSRDKSSRAAVAPDSRLDEIEESQPAPSQITTQIATVLDTPLSPTGTLATPHTMVSTPTTLTSPTTPRARNTLKTARPRPPEGNAPSQEQYGWKPPPLFQAYPQSTKHECLSAPAMSADAILRLHATGKSAGDDSRSGTSGQDEKKKEQRERKHMRTLSGTINKVEWTQKIFVLATAGFILQYTGEGKHDRLPEKMLQLGPHSVAFASDAIPGRHWVVQISQNPAADAVNAPEPPKPRLTSRFGFHRSHARRLARSFLMVFDNPDSMISWLMAIRAEVEARGGPKFTMEKHSEDEVEPRLRSKASVRQMVKKDPHRISSLFLQPQSLRLPGDDGDGKSVGGITLQSRRSSYVSDNRRSMLDSRAGSVSTGWTEATPPMNHDPPVSPTAPSNPYGLPESVLREVDQMIARSPPSSSNGNSQSLYMSPTSPPASVASQPQTSNIPETFARSASPPAPNFSVPSFSKKFVPRQGPAPVNIQASSPPSVSGVLLRGESVSDMTISSVSSPPQSPTYSAASSRHTDLSEPAPLPRDGTGRTLRTYNSEDVLSRVVRSSQAASNFSRVPRTPAPAETSPPPSRPLSLIGRSGLGIQMNGESQPPSAPPAAPLPQPPVSQPAPRNRVPSAHADAQRPQSMSRRKSMPGLAVGPPAAPPPNCPLPKIPSPIAAKAPPTWSKSKTTSPTTRFYQSQQVQSQVFDNRKSGLPEPNTPRTAARQSRML
ncbi:hypothetical protein N7532_000767 [Penicillium argentinense]|uniref:PH domain-containing protein n=1 Tax=Penicillium argentinense TaxID=1131581 RepID=A0A9W9G654_9EURO|nr:uncharacterized protein N7532_000767 [Penicillium argentinense]KAJ5112722.1 hypothetical protein N7532_000767 [Penicillium argentinense]